MKFNQILMHIFQILLKEEKYRILPNTAPHALRASGGGRPKVVDIEEVFRRLHAVRAARSIQFHVRTGVSWADVPIPEKKFSTSSVFKYYSLWCENGLFRAARTACKRRRSYMLVHYCCTQKTKT